MMKYDWLKKWMGELRKSEGKYRNSLSLYLFLPDHLSNGDGSKKKRKKLSLYSSQHDSLSTEHWRNDGSDSWINEQGRRDSSEQFDLVSFLNHFWIGVVCSQPYLTLQAVTFPCFHRFSFLFAWSLRIWVLFLKLIRMRCKKEWETKRTSFLVPLVI